MRSEIKEYELESFQYDIPHTTQSVAVDIFEKANGWNKPKLLNYTL